MTKILAIDIDGTLVEKGAPISEENRQALNRLMKDDFLVGLASGRQVSAIDKQWEKWGLDRPFDFYIGMNGAMLKDEKNNRSFDHGLMSIDDVKRLVKTLEPLHISTNYYCEDDYNYIKDLGPAAMRSLNRNKDYKFKIIESLDEIAHLQVYRVLFRIDEDKMKMLQDYVAEHPFDDDFEGFRTDHECYEVMQRGISKGKALEDYCRLNNLTLDDAYAFGDTSNDVTMLKACHGVCLSNGTEDAKVVSEYITDLPCDKSGFADFVNKFFYSE